MLIVQCTRSRLYVADTTPADQPLDWAPTKLSREALRFDNQEEAQNVADLLNTLPGAGFVVVPMLSGEPR